MAIPVIEGSNIYHQGDNDDDRRGQYQSSRGGATFGDQPSFVNTSQNRVSQIYTRNRRFNISANICIKAKNVMSSWRIQPLTWGVIEGVVYYDGVRDSNILVRSVLLVAKSLVDLHHDFHTCSGAAKHVGKLSETCVKQINKRKTKSDSSFQRLLRLTFLFFQTFIHR